MTFTRTSTGFTCTLTPEEDTNLKGLEADLTNYLVAWFGQQAGTAQTNRAARFSNLPAATQDALLKQV